MKEIFRLLAEYTIQANHDMIRILEQIPLAKVTQDVGAYYKSILGILNHLLLSNIYWMGHLAKLIPELKPILHELPNVQPKTPTDIIWDTLDSIKPALAGVDAQLKRLVQLLPEQKYVEGVKYASSKGGEQTLIPWQVLLHLFNHQTHNRGQVAVLLDQFGVENDYSSILWRKY
ncbi:MAG: DinB family protein [Promethearchaeota archaeon CR_4]|nr:MAG: DinB family protein [Candidatus Lokiarchaeota archaeon CR_4]